MLRFAQNKLSFGDVSPDLARLVLCLAALAAGASTLILSATRLDTTAQPAWDFNVFWTAVRSNEIYAPARAPFVNPPSALLFFWPLSFADFWPSYFAWTSSSIAIFLFACRQIYSWPATLLALLSALCVKALVLGQPTLILGAAVIWAFRKPGFAIGMVLGVVASIKPQMLFLAPIALAFRREWGMLAGSIVGGIASIMASIAVFGLGLWGEWFDALGPFQTALLNDNVLSHCVGLGGLALGRGLPVAPFLIAGLTIGIGLVAWAAPKIDDTHVPALIVGASAIAAPYSLPHDLVIFAPLAASLILDRPTLRSLPAFLVFCGFYLPVVLPLMIWLIGSKDKQRD